MATHGIDLGHAVAAIGSLGWNELLVLVSVAVVAFVLCDEVCAVGLAWMSVMDSNNETLVLSHENLLALEKELVRRGDVWRHWHAVREHKQHRQQGRRSKTDNAAATIRATVDVAPRMDRSSFLLRGLSLTSSDVTNLRWDTLEEDDDSAVPYAPCAKRHEPATLSVRSEWPRTSFSIAVTPVSSPSSTLSVSTTIHACAADVAPRKKDTTRRSSSFSRRPSLMPRDFTSLGWKILEEEEDGCAAPHARSTGRPHRASPGRSSGQENRQTLRFSRLS